ncbi:glutamate-rich protein 1 isoform X2 [Budorcas taxicolor]|nr:glutamate-rich protein 1 isoform X2 [Budorcas taxicolor]
MQRLYTVGLPPKGWVPPLLEPPSCSSSESSSNSEDTGDQDLHDLPKRRRIRKHKSKKKFRNPNNTHVKPAESEKQQSLLQELQPRHTDGPTISKNKKRKLKKKQQMQRKKAAGSLTGTSSVHFMYQPEETSSEQEDVRATDGENAGGATGGGAAGAVEEQVLPLDEGGVPDAEEEEVKSTNEKADGILNFLKSTQEIYFYDGVSKDSDSGVFMESTNKLFKQLETHSVSPSDVFILDHMKTLLLLHDTKRLKSALDVFPEHCRMPLDEPFSRAPFLPHLTVFLRGVCPTKWNLLEADESARMPYWFWRSFSLRLVSVKLPRLNKSWQVELQTRPGQGQAQPGCATNQDRAINQER